jgi:hypothetical protein
MKNWKAIVTSQSELSVENTVTLEFDLYGDGNKMRSLSVTSHPEGIKMEMSEVANRYITAYEQSQDPVLVPVVGEEIIFAV